MAKVAIFLLLGGKTLSLTNRKVNTLVRTLSAVHESAPRTAYKLFAAYPLHKGKVGNP